MDLLWNERRAVYVGGIAAVLLTAPAAILWRRADVLLTRAGNLFLSLQRLAIRLDWKMNPKKSRAASALQRSPSLEVALHDRSQDRQPK
jgi:hypothetical protein